jgi:Zn-dependent alcohol dehydrogenase
MKAKAALLKARPGSFSMEEIELDDPAGEEVLVKIVATGICQTDARPTLPGRQVANVRFWAGKRRSQSCKADVGAAALRQTA